jgi:hypothetical protein
MVLFEMEGEKNYLKVLSKKLTGVLSGINRQLMISLSVAWYFFKFNEPRSFKFKQTFLSGLMNF